MSSNQASIRWFVNILLFVLLFLLSLTGLIHWVLPVGQNRVAGGILPSFRHFLGEVHELSALIFLGVMAVHIWLHWGYIRTNLNKMRHSGS